MKLRVQIPVSPKKLKNKKIKKLMLYKLSHYCKTGYFLHILPDLWRPAG
jgi:hypothetical protein